MSDLKLLFDLESAMSAAATLEDLARAMVVEAARACEAKQGASSTHRSRAGRWHASRSRAHVGCDQEMLYREEEQDEELKLGGVVLRGERPDRPSEPAQPEVSLATRPVMVWRYVGTRVDGPHATNLEMGIPGGRAASHGGEGNKRVAKEREGHETSGGVDDCGTNMKDGTATWEIRDLSAMGRVRRSATSRSERQADGKRKSEGPI